MVDARERRPNELGRANVWRRAPVCMCAGARPSERRGGCAASRAAAGRPRDGRRHRRRAARPRGAGARGVWRGGARTARGGRRGARGRGGVTRGADGQSRPLVGVAGDRERGDAPERAVREGCGRGLGSRVRCGRAERAGGVPAHLGGDIARARAAAGRRRRPRRGSRRRLSSSSSRTVGDRSACADVEFGRDERCNESGGPGDGTGTTCARIPGAYGGAPRVAG